jgi:hypothetical protein
MKYAVVFCKCTAKALVPYIHEDDVFEAQVDCHCGSKFFPTYALFKSKEIIKKELEKEHRPS